MKFCWIVVAGAMLLLPGLSGCASAGTDIVAVRPEAVTDELAAAGRVGAEQYVAGFAAALKSGDYAELEAVMPKSEGRDRISKSAFESMREELIREYGQLVAADFFGELDQTLMRDYYWAFTFERPARSAGRKGEMVREKLLYLVRVGILAGKPVIAGAGFRN